MSIIEEHISGEIQHYVPGENGAPGSWVTYENGILSDANVISASCKRQCCEDGKFTIGGVFAATMQLVCRLPGFTRYQLGNARIILRSQYAGEMQAVPVGTFWATQVTRVRDIFTIRGMDAMGWCDMAVPAITEEYTYDDCYWDPFAHYDPETGLYTGEWIHDWKTVTKTDYFAKTVIVNGGENPNMNPTALFAWDNLFFTALESKLVENTGFAGMAAYIAYNPSTNFSIQSGNYNKFSMMWTKKTPEEQAFFGIYETDGVCKTEKPRELLRWIAETQGGFFTVNRNGQFTFRNFCMPELGIAEISDSDTEAETLELAEYYVFPKWLDIELPQMDNGSIKVGLMSIPDDYTDAVSIGLQLRVLGNPVIMGYNDCDNSAAVSVAYGIYYAFVQYEDIDYNWTTKTPFPKAQSETGHIGLFKAYPVPFRCKVHKPERYELGQTIVFPDHPNRFNNYRYGYTAHVPYLRSVITSIEWTFRGGTVLSCGEGDTRSMMQLSQDGKADAVLRELRNRV